ncbi:MAG TPA: lanthionine synthetase LanC family protein [Thermoanaerobaculia bacterium]
MSLPLPGAATVPPRPASGSGAAAFLDTAASLGARVCRDALWASRLCNWIGPSMEPLGGRWRQVHRAYGPELYGGTAGIALFLARLHAASGERVFKRTALGAVGHALARAEEIEPPARIGAYSGWAGIAYAALTIAPLLADDSLRAPALAMLAAVAASELDRQNLDVLAGCAGAIAPLLRVHAELGGPEALRDAAVRFGDHLIATAVRSAAGCSWGTHGDGAVERLPWIGNLTGFSHGAGGIGWSLLELYQATGEARFREAAEGAFGYERHWFDAERGNWPDLRDPEMSGTPAPAPAGGPPFMTAWCHGAPGIGLSRLRAWEILSDERCRQEAETAIATTLASVGSGGPEMSQNNYSLCHGLGGNCDLLLDGSEVLGNPAWRERAERLALQAIETYEEQKLPWPCGTFGSVEVPGLMLGLSGIGYFYLRLADPAGTPSVLIWRGAGRPAG